MGMIFCLAYFGVILYFLCRRPDTLSGSDNKKEIDYTEVSEHIEHLKDLKEKLQAIEELINDITVCSPGKHHKSISFEWVTASGKTMRYNISVISGSTSDILKFAYAERDRLYSLLQTETKKFSGQCMKKQVHG